MPRKIGAPTILSSTLPQRQRAEARSFASFRMAFNLPFEPGCVLSQRYLQTIQIDIRLGSSPSTQFQRDAMPVLQPQAPGAARGLERNEMAAESFAIRNEPNIISYP